MRNYLQADTCFQGHVSLKTKHYEKEQNLLNFVYNMCINDSKKMKRIEKRSITIKIQN